MMYLLEQVEQVNDNDKDHPGHRGYLYQIRYLSKHQALIILPRTGVRLEHSAGV